MKNANFNAKRISALLKTKTAVKVFETVDSTNNEAKRRVKNGEARELVIVAEEQTAGRGRHGKSFYSPKGTGIYMSLLLFTDGNNLTGFTAAAAVAVCRAVEALSGKECKIKWVNDVYIDGKKVCGILCESLKAGNGKTAVITGIGVNINTADFPKTVENGGSIGCEIDRAELVAAITDGLYEILFSNNKDFMDEYRKRSLLTGKKIAFTVNGKEKTATAVGIDGSGGLEVLFENGEKQVLVSGEVSVRPEQEK